MKIACVLVPEAPLRAAADRRRLPPEDVWEEELHRLEGIGAALEPGRAGEAFFAIDGLRGLYGGEREGVVAAAREAMRLRPRAGVAPTRFAALLAAAEEEVVSVSGLRALLSRTAISRLVSRLDLPPREAEGLSETMRRLGIGTAAALAALTPAQVADRFGRAGARAHRIARGEEEPLRPRRPHEELVAELELPEGTAGDRLDHALELLVDRLLASPRRRARTVLALRLGALLADGGAWSVEQGLGRPTASPRILRGVLAPRLESLPAPAVTLRLRAIALGPPAGDQIELSIRGQEARRRRLGDAVREVRAAQGGEALLRVMQVDPASRFPERRAALTPFAP
jgi:nucleotidyltransferase/DNA polymerase involved in DNA repair